MFLNKYHFFLLLTVIFRCVAYCLNIDGLVESLGAKSPSEVDSSIVINEQVKTLKEMRESIDQQFRELDSIGYTKEMFIYVCGKIEGERIFNKAKILRTKYRRPVGKSFEENARYLEDAFVGNMITVNCVHSYFDIKKWLLPYDVPIVTGEQMKAYHEGNYSDSVAGLYLLFKRYIGIDSLCEAYTTIRKKILKDKNLAFISKYSNHEMLYYYLEDLSIDSLSEIFKEIHRFNKREISILTKWDEEHTLIKLYYNITDYYKNFQQLTECDSTIEQNTEQYIKLKKFFQEENTSKMIRYWDEKFKYEKNKILYSEIKEFIWKLQQE